MAFDARNKNSDHSPIVISIKVNEKFYQELQRQLEEAAKSMTPEQIIAFLLLWGLSFVASKAASETAPEIEQDESSLVWSYLSQLQKELPEGKALGDLLREANIQLVVNERPIDLPNLSKASDDDLIDPAESFKQGWADAHEGRTMSREEFRRRMSEDA